MCITVDAQYPHNVQLKDVPTRPPVTLERLQFSFGRPVACLGQSDSAFPRPPGLCSSQPPRPQLIEQPPRGKDVPDMD